MITRPMGILFLEQPHATRNRQTVEENRPDASSIFSPQSYPGQLPVTSQQEQDASFVDVQIAFLVKSTWKLAFWNEGDLQKL
jgi:hypothetical protein